MDRIRFDEKGLVPAVIQESRTGEVLMVAYMNREALERTLETGLTWFYSRSRRKLWQKGETPGNVQRARRAAADCDLDPRVAEGAPGGTGGWPTGARASPRRGAATRPGPAHPRARQGT